jgi:STE24 endopeptidase
MLEFPVSVAEGFRVEQRYGLSEQSLESYASDWAKSTTIEAVVSAILATLAAGIVRRFPRAWPLIGMIAALPLYVLANIIVPVYILPLFNTFEPLDGPLEVRLRALASRFGVGDAEILRMDMSRQTRKANAFVTGIGTTHRIVLGDTLIDNFSGDEVEFVIAHELGHYVTRDTWRLILAAEVATATLLIGAALFERSQNGDETLRVARIAALFGAGMQLVRPAIAGFSRSREWAADRFALKATMNAQAGASAFRRLRDQNLAEEEVPAWFEFFFGTHPSLGKRIAELEAV